MTTYHKLNETTIAKAMPKIMEILPTVTSMVKGSKSDNYDYCLFTSDEKTVAYWSKITDLSRSLGWTVRHGSNLAVRTIETK